MIRVKRIVIVALAIVVAGCATPPAPAPQPQPVPPPSQPLPPTLPPEQVPPPEPPAPQPLAAPTTGGATYYQQRQEQQLRERIGATGIRLTRNGDTLRLILPASHVFAIGDQLQPRFTEALDMLAAVFREYRKTTVEIRGYTDSTGSFQHNQQLSLRRAETLAAFFAARQIDPARIRASGYGPRQPIADNRTDSGRIQNRRIEIDLVPTP